MSTSKIPLANLAATLKGYSARVHNDVSTNKGKVFFSAPLKKWILVMRKGDNAFLTFSDDCPCSEMGTKY
jgi:hypothetical protein